MPHQYQFVERNDSYYQSVRVNIAVVSYEAMKSQYGRSVVQVLLVRVDRTVVTYKTMTSRCGMSLVQVLVARVDIRVVTYKAMTFSLRDQWFNSWSSVWL